MTNLNTFIFIATLVVAVECGKSFSCPYLIRANNWEIEKFFGTWRAIESFTHVANENIKVEDTCASFNINEVSQESLELVTFGRPVDPFNYRLAVRLLKVELIGDSSVIDYYLTFNNTNQMLWKNSEDGVSMQVIKFDRTRMMLTVCIESKELLYSVLFERNDIANSESKNFVHLLLNARNLKIHSSFLCSQQREIKNTSSKLNFSYFSLTAMLAIMKIIQ